jgi:hypothetical protein
MAAYTRLAYRSALISSFAFGCGKQLPLAAQTGEDDRNLYTNITLGIARCLRCIRCTSTQPFEMALPSFSGYWLSSY